MDASELKGSIQEVERKTKGKGYRARIDQSSKRSGERKTLSKVFDDRQEAVRWLVKKNYELNEGIELNTDSVRLSDWLDKWLKDFVAQSRKKSTLDRYRVSINTHIKPALGHINLGSLSTTQIQKLYREMQLESYDRGTGGAKSASTVKAVHLVLHKALNDAMNVVPPLIDQNPARAANPPSQREQEIAYLSPDEIPSFLEVAQEAGTYNPIYLLGVASGMRPGELLGLHWGDIDWEDQQVTIRHAACRSQQDGPYISSPKTDRVRSVSLPPAAMDKLQFHRKRQKALRSKSDEEWSKPELVFSSSKGTIIRQSSLRRQWNRIVAEGGFDEDLTPHCMRHTHATWALSKGIHPKVVADRLGHSSVKITLDRYSHVIDGLESKVASQFQEDLGEAV